MSNTHRGVMLILIVAITVLLTMQFTQSNRGVQVPRTLISNVERGDKEVKSATLVTKTEAVDVKKETQNVAPNKEESLTKLKQIAVEKFIEDTSVPKDATVLQILDQVFTQGKNTAQAMFEYMDGLDKVLTGSLKKERDTVPEDMLEKYRLTKIDRNLKKFRRDYALTVLYVRNGGKWIEGCLISAFPPDWDVQPKKNDNSCLGWKKINQYEIYPSQPQYQLR